VLGIGYFWDIFYFELGEGGRWGQEEDED